jgi:hypothetical protein
MRPMADSHADWRGPGHAVSQGVPPMAWRGLECVRRISMQAARRQGARCGLDGAETERDGGGRKESVEGARGQTASEQSCNLQSAMSKMLQPPDMSNR